MRKLSAAFLLLAFVNAAPAQWTAKDVRDEPSTDSRVIHRRVDLVDSETGDHAIVDLALFSTKACKLRVIDNQDSTSLEPVVQSSGCLAAVNGGYFDPSFAPLGLRIIDGKITSRLVRGPLLTGVVVSDNVTQIFRVGEFPLRRKWNAAVECGPFLVDLGRPVRGLESTREARRTFVASGSNDRAALGYCPSATLAELAQILTSRIGDFKIQRALNLDGGSSSAFWFKREKGVVYYPEQKTVRDFVAIVPK